MAELLKRKKALSVSPLKASQTVGAALAFLGFFRSMPIMHGSQGCTAFAKVFFVRHFREPVPLQTTAMDPCMMGIAGYHRYGHDRIGGNPGNGRAWCGQAIPSTLPTICLDSCGTR